MKKIKEIEKISDLWDYQDRKINEIIDAVNQLLKAEGERAKDNALQSKSNKRDMGSSQPEFDWEKVEGEIYEILLWANCKKPAYLVTNKLLDLFKSYRWIRMLEVELSSLWKGRSGMTNSLSTKDMKREKK